MPVPVPVPVRKSIVSVLTTVDGSFEGLAGTSWRCRSTTASAGTTSPLLRDADAVVHGSRRLDGGADRTRVATGREADQQERPGLGLHAVVPAR
ncbi:MAG: hypothetical protein HIU86_12420 [Acidobacteria bacterium]|nr:hypothetical protein [Acidobacteriota bacterium]